MKSFEVISKTLWLYKNLVTECTGIFFCDFRNSSWLGSSWKFLHWTVSFCPWTDFLWWVRLLDWMKNFSTWITIVSYFLWALRFCAVAKLLWHALQMNLRLSCTDFWCIFKFPALTKVLLHESHAKLTPLWTLLMCFLRIVDRENLFSHESHLKNLMPSWWTHLMWFLRLRSALIA